MTEILCAAPLIRGTEFFLNDQGVRLFGTCGQRALASAASSALSSDVNPLGVYDSMLNHQWCDVGGASTIGGLLNQAKIMNLPIAAVQWYGEPWNAWLSWLLTQVDAGNPVVLEVANGQALVDSISGAGENAVNLQYHYIAILGSNSGGLSPRLGRNLPPGFWCADGDSFAGNNDNAHNFNALDVLQYYADTTLGAARPCAALAIKGRTQAMSWTEQSDGRGTCSNGTECGSGDYQLLVAAGKLGVDGLFSETFPDASKKFVNGSVFGLEDGTLICWDVTTGSGSVTSGSPDAAYFVKGLLNLLAATSVPVVAPTPPAPAPISQADQLAIEALAAIKAALAA